MPSDFIAPLLRRTPAVADIADADKGRHLGWLMLTALGIGATIGAGIFVMPGRIAMLAGPAGVLSFVITGFVFLFVGICYERFSRLVPQGVSAYSYVYHSIGEIFAWIVAFGLFLEYSFGASAVAVGWSVYLDRVVDLPLDSFWKGPAMVYSELPLTAGRYRSPFVLRTAGGDVVMEFVAERDPEPPVQDVSGSRAQPGPAVNLCRERELGKNVMVGLDTLGVYVTAPAPRVVQVQINESPISAGRKCYLKPGDKLVLEEAEYCLARPAGSSEQSPAAVSSGAATGNHEESAQPTSRPVATAVRSVCGAMLEPGRRLVISGKLAGGGGSDPESKDEKAKAGLLGVDDETVDARHAKFEMTSAGETYLTDLGSTNGTFVNGQKLEPGVPIRVTGEDQVRVGNRQQLSFGINIVAIAVVLLVTLICIFGGVQKSAKLNFLLVCLKSLLLVVFMVAGLQHLNPENWQPFMPKGWKGVLEGAAIAVFPYVGFDALYTFARESKSPRDTRLATYWCIGLVAFLYVAVMAIATAIAPVFPNGVGAEPNPLFVGSEASAPLANLLMATGETWAGKLIAAGAVIGIFNVLLVLSMGGPRIFRNMAEDGLLPPVFALTKAGNPTFGLLVNGVIVGGVAGFVPFDAVTDIMVLGTLVAFVFVCLGAFRLKLVHPAVAVAGAAGCILLAANLGPLVWQVYAVTCPLGLMVYFLYGRGHSKLSAR